MPETELNIDLDGLTETISTAVASRDFKTAVQQLEEALALAPENPKIQESLDTVSEAVDVDDVSSLLDQAEAFLADGQLNQAYSIADSVLKTMDGSSQRALQVLDNCYELASESSPLEESTESEAIASPNQELKDRLNELPQLIEVALKVKDYIRQGDLQSGQDCLATEARRFADSPTVRRLSEEIKELETKFQRLLKKGRTTRRKKRPEIALSALNELAELGFDKRPAVRKLRRLVENDLAKRERRRKKREKRPEGAQGVKESLLPKSGIGHERGVLAEDTAIVALRAELSEMRQLFHEQKRAAGDQERMNRLFDEIEELVKTSKFAAARLKVNAMETSWVSAELMQRLQSLLEPCSAPGHLEWVELSNEPEHERLEVRLEYRNESDREVVVRDLLFKRDGLLVGTYRNLGLRVAAGEVLKAFPGCQSCELMRGRFSSWRLQEISLEAKIRLSTGEFRGAKVRLPRKSHSQALNDSW